MAVMLDFKEVRIYTGSVAHLMDTGAPPVPGVLRAQQPALCNIRPVWPGEWYDAPVDLPLCKNCETAREAMTRGGQ